MPGPYGDGTKKYKVDTDNIHIETISSQYLTRGQINAVLTDIAARKAAADYDFDNQTAFYNSMLAVLNA